MYSSFTLIVFFNFNITYMYFRVDIWWPRSFELVSATIHLHHKSLCFCFIRILISCRRKYRIEESQCLVDRLKPDFVTMSWDSHSCLFLPKLVRSDNSTIFQVFYFNNFIWHAFLYSMPWIVTKKCFKNLKSVVNVVDNG